MFDVEQLGSQLMSHKKKQHEEEAKHHLDVDVGEESNDAEDGQPEQLEEGVQVYCLLWYTAEVSVLVKEKREQMGVGEEREVLSLILFFPLPPFLFSSFLLCSFLR